MVTFEGNVGSMISTGLKKRNIEEGKETNLLFVQGCVRNPMWKGRGPARKLLDWGIQRWWDREVRIPVWLDCTTGEGERAYTEIGFEVIGDCMVKTGCDEKGVKIKAAAKEDDKSKGREAAKQRVMVRVPEV